MCYNRRKVEPLNLYNVIVMIHRMQFLIKLSVVKCTLTILQYFLYGYFVSLIDLRIIITTMEILDNINLEKDQNRKQYNGFIPLQNTK